MLGQARALDSIRMTPSMYTWVVGTQKDSHMRVVALCHLQYFCKAE